ncbi:hypothetical protein [Paenibacillus radicis (ex Gao et al. 2016)]|uniref:Uncharacterized protein n=1 Tax=Paenibacillus radicis (ex Gao et al. 2016) TaxID=1737354 RepID=A0A917GYN6_9BACL|nr:hypothetical protein [Paenibacillus radicis (ex Gao et al. 2016)]GGG61486.1 hypothetical protein GCM10010918_13740 [Paenibacillus radicis (ex Gao et al. 2016)]
MAYPFAIEPADYTGFENEAAQISQCKEWGLLSDKATKSKVFFYKGNGLNEAVSIIGYVDKLTAVIELGDGAVRHCIHPSYLKEMQAANYSGVKAAAATEADAGEDGEAAESNEAAEAAAQPVSGGGDGEQADTAEVAQAGEAAADAAAESVKAADTAAGGSEEAPVSAKSDAASDADEPAAEEAEVRAAAKPKAPPKAKKEKAPKLELPEEKVKLTAIVQEFTTVPNHFSDTDDEVIIYEAVAILESSTDIGLAWSSHSATLKKLELEVGDKIQFDAKVVAKKLTKHPVPYKINNPAKIQKVEE